MRICFICNIIFRSQFYSNVSSHANKIRALFDFDVIMCGAEPVSHVHAHILTTGSTASKRCALWLCLGTKMKRNSTSIPGNLKTVMRFFYSCIKISSVIRSNKIYCTFFPCSQYFSLRIYYLGALFHFKCISCSISSHDWTLFRSQFVPAVLLCVCICRSARVCVCVCLDG